jgi:CBS domain containing-hemolysin-like protein
MDSLLPLGLISFFLVGSFVLTALTSSLRSLRHAQARDLILSLGKLFFYAPFQQYFFPSRKIKLLFFASICAASLTRFCFAGMSIYYLVEIVDGNPGLSAAWASTLTGTFAFLLLSLAIGDVFPRFWASRRPKQALAVSAPIASVYLILCFPFSYIFLRLSLAWWRKVAFDPKHDQGSEVQARIFEIINDDSLGQNIDPDHRRLIESAITFRDRIVREVMVPRVDVLALAADLSIQEAAHRMAEEGYSRAPVYEGDLDHIVGVLLYKELLQTYLEAVESNDLERLMEPIRALSHSALFTPETRKISHMLQEFRRKQIHLAIVVDEYGGTEGVVTMEDLLEEIVGEIEDEYDSEEELFALDSDGSIVVDARMSILDISHKLKLSIPQETDYDTLGGYIFHRAGAIPRQGMVIHHDDFDLEILSSDERRVYKVRISPLDRGDKV